ncbi:phosphodiester glycosidase family protein [Oribacterium sp. P6A1]|uniref:phosphodiester glycosidase family protein n=1 Tax=Oribacterium sp. P6A1 TaxID=1410612 RepID=UPI000A5F97D1|nr:phosphodiester glycosidase family protein [Oribacterium sp. P6A1]
MKTSTMPRNISSGKFNLIYYSLLIMFTSYALLDTFVIPKRYSADTERLQVTVKEVSKSVTAEDAAVSEKKKHERPSGGPGMAKPGSHTSKTTSATADVTTTIDTVSSDTALGTYSDSVKTITVSEYRANDTSIYVADVRLVGDATTEDSDAYTSQDLIKTAFAEDTYGKNVKAETSEIAEENNAILAINGDFYGAQNEGYVVRNGTLYRSTSRGNEDLAILTDGTLRIFSEDEVSAEEILSEGASDVLSFGPGLVIDGEIAVTKDEEVGKAMASNPRTAIGMLEDGHYVFVVTDGRTSESTGLTLYQLAEFMQSLGCTTAYNLDGGGSSTMYFNGQIVNKPTTGGNKISERSVSDIIYIAKQD